MTNTAGQNNKKGLAGKVLKTPLFWISAFGLFILVCAFCYTEKFTKYDGWLGEYHCEELWDVWELAALSWSFLFVIYYAIEFRALSTRRGALPLFGLVVLSALIPLLGIISLLGLDFLNFNADRDHWLSLMFGCTLSIVYFAIDYLLATMSDKNSDERKNYMESFWLADVPTVATNLIIFTWLIIGEKPKEWESFAGGIIAAQLISCNFIFVVTQAKTIRNIWNGGK